MKEELEKLKNAYCDAKTDKEFDAISDQMTQLADKDHEKFSVAMIEMAKDTAERATNLAIRERLKDTLPALSMAYIAKTYFKRTSQWLYQRINGNEVNGKPAQFTSDELHTLEMALKDISHKISSVNFS